MVKMYIEEENTKVVSIQQPYTVEHITLTSKKFHASMVCYRIKIFIFCTIYQHKIHEQLVFPRSLIFVFNSRKYLLYLTDWPNLIQSRYALNNTELMP